MEYDIVCTDPSAPPAAEFESIPAWLQALERQGGITLRLVAVDGSHTHLITPEDLLDALTVTTPMIIEMLARHEWRNP